MTDLEKLELIAEYRDATKELLEMAWNDVVSQILVRICLEAIKEELL